MKYEVGCRVYVQLWDGRKVVGTVEEIFHTTSGWRVRILSGDTVLTVSTNQVIGVLPRPKERVRSEK